MDQDYYFTRTWDNQCNNHTLLQQANHGERFVYSESCDMCKARGCYVCNGSGMITYYFNSEPDEPNVIEMMNKMMNY